MRIGSFKWGFIPFLFALALLMAFASAPVYPQVGGPWRIEVIVDNTVYLHHDPIEIPSGSPQVVQGGIFIIRHKSSWTEPEYSGSYSIPIYWDCYDNHENENFTFLYTQAYFITGENAGEAIENTVIFQALPMGAHTRYAVSVSATGDDRDGQFSVDVVMRASGAGGVPHIPTDNATITYGQLSLVESTPIFTEVDPISIEVLPPPNQSPIADFNFSPEHPREGANVYFFDSSYDPDGYIVGWYWSYSLIFGAPTLPMPFEEGEQNKPNPTLTFEFGGGYPDLVQVNLHVTDDDGAVNYAHHTIQTDWMSPPSSPSELPIADFNFSPEQPTAGEEVYFFDNSEDPDGYIVEWYWYYSLNFGDDYWTCFMPFGGIGEPNPTLNLDYYAEKAQITLVVMDVDGATDSASRIIEILPIRGVEVSISPTQQGGLTGATLTYTVTVTNFDTVEDNYDLAVSDNENWGPTLSENLLENVGPGENRTATLSVTIPSGTICTIDNITITVTSRENSEIYDNIRCSAHRSKARFVNKYGIPNRIRTLYEVWVDLNVLLRDDASELVLKFYSWLGASFQGENVVSTTMPAHLRYEYPDVWKNPHPQGKAVAEVELVLEDAQGTEIQTITTFTVTKTMLEVRFAEIPLEWALAPQENKIKLELEFSAIPLQWPIIPS